MENPFKRKPKPLLGETAWAKKYRRTHIGYGLLIVSILLWTYTLVGFKYHLEYTEHGQGKQNVITETLRISAAEAVVELPASKEPDRDELSLSLLAGTPLDKASSSILAAARKWEVPVGLITGIAKIESNLGRAYYLPYDKDNCYNAWGIKPATKTGQRPDGSWLRCYQSWDESANDIARMLRTRYFDRGLDTVEKIAPVYKCGGLHGSKSCLSGVDNWIAVVYKNGYF